MKQIALIYLLSLCHMSQGQNFRESTSGNTLMALGYGVQQQSLSGLNEYLFGDNKKFKDDFHGPALVVNGIPEKGEDTHEKRVDIGFIYQQFLPKTVITDTSTHYLRGYNLLFTAGKDVLYKGRSIDLLYVLGFNYGKIKLNRLSEYNTYRNPFFGICGGLEFRTNIYGKKDKGITLGMRGQYQLDVSRATWKDKDNIRQELPKIRFNCFSAGVFIGRCSKAD